MAGEVPVEDIPLSDWSPQATVHFINNLPGELSEDQLSEPWQINYLQAHAANITR